MANAKKVKTWDAKVVGVSDESGMASVRIGTDHAVMPGALGSFSFDVPERDVHSWAERLGRSVTVQIEVE